MEIRVEWKAKPASGETTLSLSDLECKTKKEWLALDRKEQEIRINAELKETDGYSLNPIVVQF